MKRLSLSTLLIGLSACGALTDSPSIINRSEVPSTHKDYAILGQAFHKTQKRLYNVACVRGTVSEKLGNTEAQFDMGVDLKFSDVVSRLGGKLSVGVDFPVVRAGPSANYGKDMAATEHINNYHFSWNITPKKQVLLPGTYQLTELGKRYVASKKKALLDKCGDEFISAIEYGASLNVNLRIEYRNEEDKREIGGKLQVKIGDGFGVVGDIIDAAGDLNYLSTEIKKSVKISIRAVQKGGDPLQLLKIVPGNLVSCTLENPKPCFQVFDKAIRYAKEDLSNQFKSPDSYNIIKYHTERYDESGISELVPSSYPTLDLLIENGRMELDEKFQEALLDQQRASRLLSAYTEWLTPEQSRKVAEIEAKAKSNARIYSQAAIHCFDQPYQSCLETIDAVKDAVKPYKRSDLSIKGTNVVAYFKCEYARLVAVQYQLVSPRFALGYQKRGWAPIFIDPYRPEEGLQIWGECSQALLTYGTAFDHRS